MVDYDSQIADLEYKIKLVLDENVRLREAVSSQKQAQEILKRKLEEKEKDVETLKENIKILKIRNAVEEKGDAKEVKLRINQMIRDIDKCLSILRKTE